MGGAAALMFVLLTHEFAASVLVRSSTTQVMGTVLFDRYALRRLRFDRVIVALVLLWDDPGSTSFLLTAIGAGTVLYYKPQG